MSTQWKPAEYPSLSPCIMVERAQRVVDFLKAVFSGTEHRRFDRSGGGIMHVEVRIDDSVVMLADATPDYPAYPVWLHVYTPDADAAYQRALKAGGVSVQEPRQQEGDPDRRSGDSPRPRVSRVAQQSGLSGLPAILMGAIRGQPYASAAIVGAAVHPRPPRRTGSSALARRCRFAMGRAHTHVPVYPGHLESQCPVCEPRSR